uniref:dCTP pyrophosphatase 1 n=1 Tax=Callorhinchus milii TaxID=7868 RepID=A0A4W3GRL1_CALMI
VAESPQTHSDSDVLWPSPCTASVSHSHSQSLCLSLTLSQSFSVSHTLPLSCTPSHTLSVSLQWRDGVSAGLPGWTEREREAVGEELSDVLIYLVTLASCCHIDLPQAAARKMAINCQKYPVQSARGSARKYTN